MRTRFADGRDTLIGFGDTLPVPIPLPAAPYRGAAVHGANGLIYASDGLTWRSMVDEARAAQIARDVAENVFRLQTEDFFIRVGPGTEVVGERYNTLRAALVYASSFIPAVEVAPVYTIILVESGVTLAEQAFIRGIFPSHVYVFAEDDWVPVSKAAITRPDPVNNNFFPFLYASQGGLPNICCGLELTPPYNAAVDPLIFAIHGRDANISMNGDLQPTVPKPLTASANVGARYFRHGIRARRGSVGLIKANLDDNHTPLFLQEVNALLIGVKGRGYTGNGALISGGQVTFDSANPAVGICDLRQDGATEGTADISVAGGAIVSVLENTGAGLLHRGGFSLPENELRNVGAVLRPARPSRTYVRSNVVGPVAFSDGANAGALFEPGTGPNGSFRRTAEGFLECRHRLLVKPASDATPGIKAATWNLPAEFWGGATTIAVTITVDTTNPQLRGRVSGRAISNTEVDVRYFEEGAGTATDVFATVTARGRWRA